MTGPTALFQGLTPLAVRMRPTSLDEVAGQSHLLRAYDAEFLTDAVLRTKQRCRAALEKCGGRTLPQFDWADARWGETGV